MRAVSRVVARTPGVSNAEIARLTGLAPQTVSAVLTSLDGAGLLTRGVAQRRGGRGQPATPVYLNAEGAFAVGVEIGWERLEVALVDMAGRVVERLMRSYDYPEPTQIFAELGNLVPAALGSLTASEQARVIGLGVAVPNGLGQPSDLLPAPDGQAERWSGVDVRAEAERATGLPARLLSDGNAACWAEFLSRSRPLPANFAFLHVGTFLSAGLSADGRLWEGSSTSSADFGAMLVTDDAGAPRLVQDIASLQALKLRLRATGSSLAEVLGDEPADDPRRALGGWIDDAGRALAQAILNATTLLAVDLVVLDGALPHSELERLVAATHAELNRIGAHRHDLPRICVGNLGRAGAAQGAAMLQIYRRYFSRELADLDEE
jgi:predicted NBD/HSP70 family sugar kinase